MLEKLLLKPQNWKRMKTLRNCGSALYRIAVHCMKLQRNLQCVVVKYSALVRYRCACTLFTLATGAFDLQQKML